MWPRHHAGSSPILVWSSSNFDSPQPNASSTAKPKNGKTAIPPGTRCLRFVVWPKIFFGPFRSATRWWSPECSVSNSGLRKMKRRRAPPRSRPPTQLATTSSWGLPTSPATQNPGHMWWKTRRTMGRWSPRIGENPSQCQPDVRYELERLPRQAQNYVLPRQPTTVEPMAEFIYQMIKTRKKVGDKVILDDVTMSFYPGAKIGMDGPNGAGKSTI